MQALSGEQIDSLSEKQLEQTIDSVCVFFRVTPKHKLAIVKVCKCLYTINKWHNMINNIFYNGSLTCILGFAKIWTNSRNDW